MKTSILVDTNVFIDVFRGDSGSLWSRSKLIEFGSRTVLGLNPVVWSELAAGFPSSKELTETLAGLALQRYGISFDVAFAAGRAHAAYRQAGGTRERTLPDFLIGAHALLEDRDLLTRDPKRYRSHFPDLEIIAQDTHP